MNSAVERAIKFMCERYSEPLSLADVADSAILSRFHFCRTFREATGVTPGRFLSAIRIYQAKRMLLNSRMSVTDIAFAVGYNSLGSFSNHFTDSVGISPGRLRRISQNDGIKLSRAWGSSPLNSAVTGTILFPAGYAGARAYLAAFDTPIVQRRPVSAVIVEVPATAEPIPFQLREVPRGTWFFHAVAVADNADPEPWTRRTLLVGGSGPVSVAAADTRLSAGIKLRPRKPTDLPILLALPDLEPEGHGEKAGSPKREKSSAPLVQVP
jgi:AraC family transcriptional regulator